MNNIVPPRADNTSLASTVSTIFRNNPSLLPPVNLSTGNIDTFYFNSATGSVLYLQQLTGPVLSQISGGGVSGTGSTGPTGPSGTFTPGSNILVTTLTGTNIYTFALMFTGATGSSLTLNDFTGTNLTSTNITGANITSTSNLNANFLKFVNATGSSLTSNFITLNSLSVNLGSNSGKPASDIDRIIAIGRNAGRTNQRALAIAIGESAGRTNQSTLAIAIGTNAGAENQAIGTIAIGYQAGQTQQGNQSIAIGYQAGQTQQGNQSVAIGSNAGAANQASGAVAIGSNAGAANQASGAIAIGYQTGQTSQGTNSIAIGYQAGQTQQGNNSIAIGYRAGQLGQSPQSVCINASTDTLSATNQGFYVNPVRNDNTTVNNFVYYNTTTKELTYNTDLNFVNATGNSLFVTNFTGTNVYNSILGVNATPTASLGNIYTIYKVSGPAPNSCCFDCDIEIGSGGSNANAFRSPKYNYTNDRTDARWEVGLRLDSIEENDRYFIGRAGVSSNDLAVYQSGNVGLGLGSAASYQLQLSSDSAAKPTSGTWTIFSDERVKEEIQDADIDLCYDIIKNLKLKRFKWSEKYFPETKDRYSVGYIAQEVKEIFPKSVDVIKQTFVITKGETKEEDIKETISDFNCLNVDQINKTLHGCVRKLIEKVEEQSLKISELENKIESLITS
jgi:hypothetical protein